MMTTNNINIALPFRHLNEDEMSSMYRCDSTHGEGKLNSGNNDFLADIDPDIGLFTTNDILANQTKYYNIPDFNNTKMDLNNVSILVRNIRSSYKNLDSLKNFIKNLTIKWTFIKITETWGKPNTIEQQFIPGYIHVFDIRSKRTGGGSSLYINENISYKVRKDLKLAESAFIEVSKNIFTKNRNIILGVIYRSPDSQLSMFNESLENILIQIDNEKSIAYLSGDFNVNTAEVLSCKSQTIHDFINVYSSFHYHKLINQPTRIILHKNSIKTATLIDNIIIY